MGQKNTKEAALHEIKEVINRPEVWLNRATKAYSHRCVLEPSSYEEQNQTRNPQYRE